MRAAHPRGRRLAAVAAAIGLALVSAAASRARPAGVSELVVRGHGFGHGVGLSQWGAEMRALGGRSYRQILAFYYPGTVLGRTADRPVRVLLAERPRVQIGSRAPFEVVDAGGAAVGLAAGRHAVGPDGVVDGRALRLPAVVRPGAAPVRLGGTAYDGTLTLVRVGNLLRVVNTLPLERYLVGVVSSECPGTWKPDALRAQAVASRSYAVSSLNPGADFDVYPDDRSQNYHGLLRQLGPAAAAVRATRGQVLLYGGRLVGALFTAANGGLTSTADGIWGPGSPPYYAVRRDPYDARSPDTDWGPVVVPLAAARQAFPQIPDPVAAVQLTRNTGRRVTAITFVGADGASAIVGGYAFQQRFGLRSTYLEIDAR